MNQRKIALWVFVFLMLAATVALFSRPPIPQDTGYHDFADGRAFLGIPNFRDVASNLPFLIVGLWALLILLRREGTIAFRDQAERWAYVVTFVGLTFTFFGSSYYHWQPCNARLVWDRLPYTLIFAGLLAASLAERISLKAGSLSLIPLSVLSPSSILYWNWTEAHGRGDLRPYILVQFGSVAAITLMLILFRSRYSHSRWIFAALAAYVLAKVLEALDKPIYSFGHIVSGHTLKHLAAALSMYLLLVMLLIRRPLALAETAAAISTSRSGMAAD